MGFESNPLSEPLVSEMEVKGDEKENAILSTDTLHELDQIEILHRRKEERTD